MYKHLKFVEDTPSTLMAKGLSADDVVIHQARLLSQGCSLWDYISFAYQYGKPYSPVLQESGEVSDKAPPRHPAPMQMAPPKPAPTPEPVHRPKRGRTAGQPYGARDIHKLVDVPAAFDLKPYLSRLTADQRWLLSEYYIHNRSRDSLCEELNWKHSTFNGAVSRALNALRGVLRKAGVPHA